MTPIEAAAILGQHNAWLRDIQGLRLHNAWRRDIHNGSSLEMQSYKIVCEAIDVAAQYITQAVTMEEVLRQIADMKRRTREQRLAKSCVVFFDALGGEG